MLTDGTTLSGKMHEKARTDLENYVLSTPPAVSASPTKLNEDADGDDDEDKEEYP
jgi:hypothetical protein